MSINEQANAFYDDMQKQIDERMAQIESEIPSMRTRLIEQENRFWEELAESAKDLKNKKLKTPFCKDGKEED